MKFHVDAPRAGLHYPVLCYICNMSRGASGRIVIEVDPELKAELYGELGRDGRTLKTWFIESARAYINRRQQPVLFDDHTIKFPIHTQ
jgi:hypothetical protein